MNSTKPTTLFWVVAIIALLWNLMGASAFMIDTFATDLLASSYTEEQMEFFANLPSWSIALYGIATFGGLLASIALILKKKTAILLFLISVVASTLHFLYVTFATDMLSLYSIGEAVVFPIIVIIIGIFLYLFSKHAHKQGWIH